MIYDGFASLQALANLPSNSQYVAKGKQYCEFDGFGKHKKWLQKKT